MRLSASPPVGDLGSELFDVQTKVNSHDGGLSPELGIKQRRTGQFKVGAESSRRYH